MLVAPPSVRCKLMHILSAFRVPNGYHCDGDEALKIWPTYCARSWPVRRLPHSGSGQYSLQLTFSIEHSNVDGLWPVNAPEFSQHALVANESANVHISCDQIKCEITASLSIVRQSDTYIRRRWEGGVSGENLTTTARSAVHLWTG